MNQLLESFKRRMKIFHDTQDDELIDSLTASKAAIKSMTGTDDITKPEVKELVIERSRYAYNDTLEYFEDNFQSTLIRVAFDNTVGDVIEET